MKFFKTEELANEYKISERTVQRWITWAKSGKLHLELYSTGKRSFIVDTPENELVIKQLLSSNKKYKNKIGLQIIEPKKEFYELFDESQIIDIITNLEIFKELPIKYCYFDKGAEFWDKYIKRVLKEEEPITIKSTLELLNYDKEYISALIDNFSSVNIVDIGPGNGFAIKEFVEFLISKGKLRKYIAIDFSPDILRMTKENMTSWFGNNFPFEGHLRDVTRDSFQELLFQNTHFSDIEEVHSLNLVFFLGSTVENERHYEKTLGNILDCLGKQDIFILGQLLDTEQSRIHINFQEKDKIKKEELDVETLIISLAELMNINEELYEIKRFYNKKERVRMMQMCLRNDLSIKVRTPNIKKELNFSSKEKITIFRHNHHTSQEIINKMSDLGFEILKTSVSLDKQQILITSNIKGVNS